MAKLAPKWWVLGLTALTFAVVVALPSMALSVLFKEISDDLKLSLVQVGMVWGISWLPSIATSWVSGPVVDRFGPKRVLLAAVLLAGVFGGMRGLAHSFGMLVVFACLLGGVVPFVTVSGFKTAGTWFPSSQLGLANGVLSMGMALGFLLGSMLSATLVSPWLGGWRSVFIFYGGLGLLLIPPWFLMRGEPDPGLHKAARSAANGMAGAFGHVARNPSMWLLGLTVLGISGAVQGALGYLPLYLRNLSWSNLSASSALAMFHTLSMCAVVPIALWSDRPGKRKNIFLGAAVMIALGFGGLALATGSLIWLAVGFAGVVRDGFMAVYFTSVIETEGIGPAYAGTATGFVNVFSGIGNMFSPMIGNSLAGYAPGAPFGFWSLLAGMAVVMIILLRRDKVGITPPPAPPHWGGE
jgi:MFS family permease